MSRPPPRRLHAVCNLIGYIFPEFERDGDSNCNLIGYNWSGAGAGRLRAERRGA